MNGGFSGINDTLTEQCMRQTPETPAGWVFALLEGSKVRLEWAFPEFVIPDQALHGRLRIKMHFLCKIIVF